MWGSSEDVAYAVLQSTKVVCLTLTILQLVSQSIFKTSMKKMLQTWLTLQIISCQSQSMTSENGMFVPSFLELTLEEMWKTINFSSMKPIQIYMLLNSVMISVSKKRSFSNVYQGILTAHEKKALEEKNSESCLENSLE